MSLDQCRAQCWHVVAARQPQHRIRLGQVLCHMLHVVLKLPREIAMPGLLINY